MKVVCLADTQGYANYIDPSLVPDADMLVVGGDLAGGGSLTELGAFNNWLGELPHKYKVIVGGNHDQGLRQLDGHSFFTNGIYLQDELIEIEGLKIYGSPVNEMNELRKWYDWAFCDPQYLERACEAIPEGLDILLTHGGPYGILDQLQPNHAGVRRSVGSKDLLRAVQRAKPQYHVFGHIHEAYGMTQVWDTTFVNAAVCNFENDLFPLDEDGREIQTRLLQPPRVITITPRSAE